MDPIVKICAARKEDEEKLVALINCAFTGFTTSGICSPEDAVGGWTNENHLFKDTRPRLVSTSPELPLLKDGEENVTYLKAEEEETGKILACVKVEMNKNVAYIGILSVLPAYQSKGIGSRLMRAAEELAEAKNADKITMTVINARDSLVNYYLKRGYRDSGERAPFPFRPDDVATIPLELVILEKCLGE